MAEPRPKYARPAAESTSRPKYARQSQRPSRATQTALDVLSGINPVTGFVAGVLTPGSRQERGARQVMDAARPATRALNDLSTLATQGAAFGQQPRLVGGLAALTGGDYAQARDAERQRIAQARARMPVSGAIAETAGGLVTGTAIANMAGAAARQLPGAGRALAAVAPQPGVAAGRLGRVAGRTALAAGGGAALGAAYGSGEGNAAQGAIAGALGGAAAEPVGRGLAAGGRALARIAGFQSAPPEQAAARVLAQRVAPDAERRIAEAQRLGLQQPALIDVLNEGGRGRVRAASLVNEEARQAAVDYAGDVVESAAPNAQRVVQRMTGQRVNIPQAREAAQEAVRAADTANYGALSGQTAEITDDMRRVLNTREGVKAIDDAIALADINGAIDDVAALRALRNQVARTDVVQTRQGLSEPGMNDAPVVPPQPPMQAAPRQPQRLLSFIQGLGGVNPQEAMRADVRAIMDRRYFQIANGQTGRDLDAIREAAEEAGFLRPGSTIDDLLRAMDADVRGAPVYSDRDLGAVADYEEALARNTANEAEYARDPTQFNQPVTPADLDRMQADPNFFGPARDAMPNDGRVSVTALDRVYQVLRDRGRALSMPTSEQRALGRGVTQAARQFDEQLQAAAGSPALQQARAESARLRGEASALDEGFDIFRPSILADEATMRAQRMTPRQLEMARLGAQGQLQEQIGNNPAAVLRSIRTQNKMQKLNAVAPDAASDMRAGADIELRRLANAAFINPNVGSQSTPRALDAAAAAVEGGLPTGLRDAFGKLMRFAFRRGSGLTQAEMQAVLQLGIEPADLARLQQLAAYAPDQVPVAIQAMLGVTATNQAIAPR